MGGNAEELNTAYESFYEKEKETSNYLYEKYIVLDLEVQINAFGENKLAKFTAATESLLDAGQIKLLSQLDALTADKTDLEEKLQAHTTAATENTIAGREAHITTLNEFQIAAEERDKVAREVIMTDLETKKNKLWKDISWNTRKQ